MSIRAAFLLLLAAAVPARAGGLNRTTLVPVYAKCPGSGNCPAVRASSYTFEQMYLYSPRAPYSGPGKLALMLQVKGLKDANGSPVTGRLTIEIPASRITILSQGIGTLGENSPLAAQPPYVVDVKNGAARAKFLTPSTTPENGLIVNTFGAPVVYDPEGKELASTGTQSKP
jgi:hypothetical protein